MQSPCSSLRLGGGELPSADGSSGSGQSRQRPCEHRRGRGREEQRCIARRLLHRRLQAAQPAGDFNRDEIKSYFAALRDSFTDFTISRAQIIVDGNLVSARTVMAGRFDKEFAYTPIGTVEPNGRQVQWELINIFRYTDEGRLVEEWVQTDTDDFLRQLGAVT